jgi:D-alanyl-D-alanine carboxypeptidase
MIEIGRLALQNEALREIMSEQMVEFEYTGLERNTNLLLAEGFSGIKTGNSDQALSCLLFAREYGGDVVIGVLMGQPFNSTFDSARRIWGSLDQNFAEIEVPAGTVVGKYRLAWGGEVEAVLAEPLSAYTWRDGEVEVKLDPIDLNTNYKSRVGTATLGNQTVNLRLNQVLPEPSLLWRLQNLF